jgi:ABC-type multidrug transport system permease subunit
VNARLSGIASVARKEVLHIVRDFRIMVLVLTLPPLLTFIFGHAFENTEVTDVPMSLEDSDHSPESASLAALLQTKKTFAWHTRTPSAWPEPDLLREGVQGSLVIPKGWGAGLMSGVVLPLQLFTDGSDTTTSDQIEGALRAALADFQREQLQPMIDDLPPQVFEMAEKLPVQVRKRFTSSMEPWPLTKRVLYNPGERFIEFVIPGIIGLILQLLTVTLMACTIARERESGTIYQLLVTSLRRSEIVLGKVLPYLVLSILLIALSAAVAAFHFDIKFRQPLVLALICLLFLWCSLGLGLLISAVCRTQAQAIQLAVFYLLPVFPLSGAVAPLENLPGGIRMISETFPLTHFCHAFRLINLQNADLSFIASDLAFLAIGAVVTCAGAGWLLRRMHE